MLGLNLKIPNQNRTLKIGYTVINLYVIFFAQKTGLIAACFKLPKAGLGIKIGPRQAEHLGIAGDFSPRVGHLSYKKVTKQNFEHPCCWITKRPPKTPSDLFNGVKVHNLEMLQIVDLPGISTNSIMPLTIMTQFWSIDFLVFNNTGFPDQRSHPLESDYSIS